jgi:hypothetical protein
MYWISDAKAVLQLTVRAGSARGLVGGDLYGTDTALKSAMNLQ